VHSPGRWPCSQVWYRAKVVSVRIHGTLSIIFVLFLAWSAKWQASRAAGVHELLYEEDWMVWIEFPARKQYGRLDQVYVKVYAFSVVAASLTHKQTTRATVSEIQTHWTDPSWQYCSQSCDDSRSITCKTRSRLDARASASSRGTIRDRPCCCGLLGAAPEAGGVVKGRGRDETGSGKPVMWRIMFRY